MNLIKVQLSPMKSTNTMTLDIDPYLYSSKCILSEIDVDIPLLAFRRYIRHFYIVDQVVNNIEKKQ